MLDLVWFKPNKTLFQAGWLWNIVSILNFDKSAVFLHFEETIAKIIVLDKVSAKCFNFRKWCPWQEYQPLYRWCLKVKREPNIVIDRRMSSTSQASHRIVTRFFYLLLFYYFRYLVIKKFFCHLLISKEEDPLTSNSFLNCFLHK